MTKEEKVRKIKEIDNYLEKAYNIICEVFSDEDPEINLLRERKIRYIRGCCIDARDVLVDYKQMIEEEA